MNVNGGVEGKGLRGSLGHARRRQAGLLLRCRSRRWVISLYLIFYPFPRQPGPQTAPPSRLLCSRAGLWEQLKTAVLFLKSRRQFSQLLCRGGHMCLWYEEWDLRRVFSRGGIVWRIDVLESQGVRGNFHGSPSPWWLNRNLRGIKYHIWGLYRSNVF